MQTVVSNLRIYAVALKKSADETTRSEDRSVYTQHLAAVTRMFVAAFAENRGELESLVAIERRAFGWGYLFGDAGQAAEQAFHAFAESIQPQLDPVEVVRAYPITDRLTGWFFRAEEASASIYLVEGIDLWGNKVRRTGADPETLFKLCIDDANKIITSGHAP